MFYESKIPEELAWNPNSAKHAPQSTHLMNSCERTSRKSSHTFANGASNKFVGKHKHSTKVVTTANHSDCLLYSDWFSQVGQCFPASSATLIFQILHYHAVSGAH